MHEVTAGNHLVDELMWGREGGFVADEICWVPPVLTHTFLGKHVRDHVDNLAAAHVHP